MDLDYFSSEKIVVNVFRDLEVIVVANNNFYHLFFELIICFNSYANILNSHFNLILYYYIGENIIVINDDGI